MAGGGLHCNVITVSLVTIGTVIAIFFMISVVVLSGRSNIPEVCESYSDDMKVTQYGIVIEVETPFPKPRLFSWKFDINGSLGKVEEKTYRIKQNKKKPSAFLESCVDSISRIVPRDQHETTEVFLLATDEIEALKLQTKLDEVRVLLSSYAFNTSNGTFEPHVMTANDIARHRWTRENELLGIIKPDINPGQNYFMEKDRTKLTYGLLEVTHSSARITYEVKIDGNSSLTANENVGTLELYAEEYSVFTRSISCYGLRAAYRRFQHDLIDKMIKSSKDTIANPCTPPGYHETVRSSDLHKRSSCVLQSTFTNNGSDVDASISRQSTQPELYRLEGTGDAKACESEVKRLSLGMELQPVPGGKFMAYFPYFLVDLSHVTDLTNSSDQCDWTHMPADMFKTEVNITGMNPCFVANYLHSLVFDDLKMDRENWEDVIMHEDNRLDHRWFLGFVTGVVSNLQPPTFACVLVPDPILVQRKQQTVLILTVAMIFGFVLVALGYGFACQRGDDNEWIPSSAEMYQFEQV
ncbi:ectonucleoside triphosphate diphosphohydrolase 1-like [Asterias amurensis]|uniref:ectonucleoside triphosphate diphosphohydrolase 1-like n=1 Tax=Asterias amurensis TaxID=7602 RepID=UPI003AB73804